METIHCFLNNLRDLLARSSFDSNSDGYLDLAANETLNSIEGLLSAVPPCDNLISFQETILAEIARCNSDKIKMGINELLKHLLIIINADNEHYLAERFLYRLRMIFKRCLLPDFPYAEEIWNYICDCLRSTGTFLVDHGYFGAAQEVIDSLASMGRIAALKGLPTAKTQSSLRILENKALAKNEKQLASIAKNARFNLEI